MLHWDFFYRALGFAFPTVVNFHQRLSPTTSVELVLLTHSHAERFLLDAFVRRPPKVNGKHALGARLKSRTYTLTLES